MKRATIIIGGLLCTISLIVPVTSFGEEEKNVTVITGHSSADGKSTVSAELLEECIGTLPDPKRVEAVVTSETVYLKAINGNEGKNEFVKTFTAVIDINYMVYQKELIIITTNSVQKQEPVTKLVDKELMQKQTFISDPSVSGEVFAGKSDKKYYFTTADAAIQNVKKKAEIWLSQQAAVVCKKNGTK
ncbi:MAG: hypothetical protein JW795_21240 [Chitinivibrionales bacterium]|nr:hypothetical protein [Chitinivibrionales bacterium]